MFDVINSVTCNHMTVYVGQYVGLTIRFGPRGVRKTRLMMMFFERLRVYDDDDHIPVNLKATEI